MFFAHNNFWSFSSLFWEAQWKSQKLHWKGWRESRWDCGREGQWGPCASLLHAEQLVLWVTEQEKAPQPCSTVLFGRSLSCPLRNWEKMSLIAPLESSSPSSVYSSSSFKVRGGCFIQRNFENKDGMSTALGDLSLCCSQGEGLSCVQLEAPLLHFTAGAIAGVCSSLTAVPTLIWGRSSCGHSWWCEIQPASGGRAMAAVLVRDKGMAGVLCDLHQQPLSPEQCSVLYHAGAEQGKS